MTTTRISGALRLSITALAIASIAGCSSGGGGGGSSDNPRPPVTETTSSNGSNSGTQGGSSTTPAPTYQQLTRNLPAGERFALDVANLTSTIDSNSNVRGRAPRFSNAATIEVLADNERGDTRLRVRDPASGTDLVYTGDGSTFRSGDSRVGLYGVEELDYTRYGAWVIPNTRDIPINFFAGGVPTQLDDMPTSGSANFSGGVRGAASSGGNINILEGDAGMSVNFATGTIRGAFTDMVAQESIGISRFGRVETNYPHSDWNDVSFRGSLNGNTFAGDTRVTSSPNNSQALRLDARGDIEGRFYGPQAAEAAGVWGLRDSSGNTAAGSFGVSKQ